VDRRGINVQTKDCRTHCWFHSVKGMTGLRAGGGFASDGTHSPPFPVGCAPSPAYVFNLHVRGIAS
jgi:hypothetical protein